MSNYIEWNAVRNHGDELASLGTRAMIVTGRHSAKVNGSLDDVVSVLSDHQIPYSIFDQVEENPSIETVMSARNQGVAFEADFVIGIGGGSPMDAAKAIAVMIKHADKPWQLLYEEKQCGGVPVVCVPTTCGTGSEVTAVAVLTRHDQKTKITAKQKLFPTLSLVDPGYIEKSACDPKGLEIIRNTSIDAMGHMIESYINTKATEESREYALRGLRIWGTIKGYLLDGIPDETEGKADVLLRLVQASNLGGYAIVTPGTSLPHGMSYELTYLKHVPHGMAIGIFQPGYMEAAEYEDQKVLLDAMGFDNLAVFKDYIHKCCVEPMFEKYLTKEEYFQIIKSVSENFIANKARVEKIPYYFDADILSKITEIC